MRAIARIAELRDGFEQTEAPSGRRAHHSALIMLCEVTDELAASDP
jgi:hypothetical protein